MSDIEEEEENEHNREIMLPMINDNSERLSYFLTTRQPDLYYQYLDKKKHKLFILQDAVENNSISVVRVQLTYCPDNPAFKFNKSK